MTFGEFIRLKRKEQGYTLRGLADKTNISPTYLSDIERGRRVAPKGEKSDVLKKYLGLIGPDIILFDDLAAASRKDIAVDLKAKAIEEPLKCFLRGDNYKEILELINALQDKDKSYIKALIKIVKG